MAISEQRTPTCIPEADLSEEELAALRPQVRSLTVLRLEKVYRDAKVQAEVAAQFSEKGPDPRWAEIQIRALLGIARVMYLDRVVEPTTDQGPEDESQGPGVAELRARVDQLLSSSSD